jgi:hypothetical protein
MRVMLPKWKILVQVRGQSECLGDGFRVIFTATTGTTTTTDIMNYGVGG